jgi:quercetin dioxygenase-like cupin family protein
MRKQHVTSAAAPLSATGVTAMKTTYIFEQGTFEAVDVLGPTIEFLMMDPIECDSCVLLGTLPPGVFVPLHSHPDFEMFYVVSGNVDVLVESGDTLDWRSARSGDLVSVPGGAKHAFHNLGDQHVKQLIITTPKLAQFFRDAGRALIAGSPLPPPTPAAIEHFLEVSARYGYWNATPAENAAVGINLPPFAG